LHVSSTNWRLTSICGARPGENIKSLTCVLALSMAATSCAVWMVLCELGVGDGEAAGAGCNCPGIVCVGVSMVSFSACQAQETAGGLPKVNPGESLVWLLTPLFWAN